MLTIVGTTWAVVPLFHSVAPAATETALEHPFRRGEERQGSRGRPASLCQDRKPPPKQQGIISVEETR